MPTLLPRVCLCLALGLSGCAVVPVTYKTHERTAVAAPAIKRLFLLPVDIEVAEISAGGLRAKRQEWTQQALTGITAELGQHLPGLQVSTPADLPPDAALADEVGQVQALFRRITINQLMSLQPHLALPEATTRAFDLGVGPLAQLCPKLGADAVLIVFIRDSYSSAGRKTVLAVTVLAAAAVGVALTPAAAPTISSAALIHEDGTLLWYNAHPHSLGDLREASGIKTFVERTLQGWPKTATTL